MTLELFGVDLYAVATRVEMMLGAYASFAPVSIDPASKVDLSKYQGSAKIDTKGVPSDGMMKLFQVGLNVLFLEPMLICTMFR
jgi:hypothetical protein